MEFDFAQMDFASRYRVLSGVVVPRPIAWVTTIDAHGTVNAAPFSFFNTFGADPPIVAIGIAPQEVAGLKDTARNIRRHPRQRFVVNLVPAELAQAMNVTATGFQAGVDELAMAGLTTQAGVSADVPRIAQSPVHLECRLATTIEIGHNRMMVGEAMHAAVADRFVLDAGKPYIDTNALGLIGRMASPGGYVRTTDTFEIKRLSPDDLGQPAREA